MIVAKPSIWDKIICDHPKVKKFRNKPFLLFNYLEVLYEGSTATEDLNFVSIEQVEPPTNQVIPNDNGTHDVGLNPFAANIEGQATSSTHIEADEMERAISASSGQKGEMIMGKITSKVILPGFLRATWNLRSSNPKNLLKN